MGVIVVGGVANPVPFAPTLVSPANGSYADLSGTPTFEWTFNPGQAGNVQSAWQMLRLVNGGSTVSYWNVSAGAWQSTSVWNSSTATTYTFPTGAWSDGNVYQWAVATQDGNGTGPASGYWTVHAQSAPTVSVLTPSGTVTTADPVVGWTVSTPAGAQQTSYRVVIYNSSQYSAAGFTPGSGPSVYDSGQQGSAFTRQLELSQVPLYLDDGVQFRAYVQVTETGGEASSWSYSAFTTNFAQPKTPSITVAATTDGVTGCPLVEVSVQAADNLFSSADAISATGSGTGTWVAGTGTTLGSGTAPGNTFGISLTAATAGNLTASTATAVAGYAITEGVEYTGLVSLRAATTGRSVYAALEWYDASGTLLSTSTGTVTTDVTTAWEQISVTATAPSNAAYVTLLVTVEAAALNEVHWLQTAGLFLGNDTTWGPGGFVGLQELIILRSDGLYFRGASIANPASISSTTQQLVFGDTSPYGDYEAVPTLVYTYTAQLLVNYGNNQSVVSELGTSNDVTIDSTNWWTLNPVTPESAINAQFIKFAPVQTEQSTAQVATGATVLTMVADTMLQSDFTGTTEIFSDAVYDAFEALLSSQVTVFISSPWGNSKSGYFRVGPQTGGLSTGVGNQVKNTDLKPSVRGAGHYTVQVNCIRQYRPAV